MYMNSDQIDTNEDGKDNNPMAEECKSVQCPIWRAITIF
jgi:hypothetical protein